MRVLLPLLLLLAAIFAGAADYVDRAAAAVDLEVTGRVIDADSRVLLQNIRVDVIDVASGDTLAADIRTDSLGQFATMISVTAVDPSSSRPDRPTLVSVYPSPASSGDVRLTYRAPVGSRTPTIEVFDAAGRRVRGSVTGAGVYFARLLFDDGAMTNTRTVIKFPGDPLAFRLDRLPDAVDETPAPKSATAQAIRLAYSHPVYVALTQDYDTGGTLTDLSAEVEPYFTTEIADESTFDVTYDEDTILIDGDARSALVVADTVNQVYTFDSAMLSSEGVTLTVGDPMIIAGLALRRITGISQEGDHTVVETEFVELTEAISDGTIAWHHTAAFNEAALKMAAIDGQVRKADVEGYKITYPYRIGEYDYVIQFEMAPNDSVQTEMTIQVSKKVGSNLTATFTGKGRLEDFQSNGNVSISNNEADAVSVSNDNVKIEIDLTLAAAGAGLGTINWTMPEVAIPWTFLIGTIPVTVNFRVQFVLSMTVQNEASATASTTMSYNGSTGFSYSGIDIDPNHETINHLFNGTNADSGANIGNAVDLQIGIAFPKIDVEVFAVPVVPSFLVGFAAGTSLTWGPVCKSGYTRIDIKAGADLKLFNLSRTLLDEVLWTREEKSDPC